MNAIRTRKRNPAAGTPVARFENLAELLRSLGNVPPERVRFDPPLGRATKRDLVRLHRATGRRYELVDGHVVENPMGSPEAFLALQLGRLIGRFLDDHDLGFLYGSDALIEVLPGLVRGPDVSFVSWSKRPGKTVPSEPISDLIPDLAVEVLSPGNSRGEMRLKLKEYFLGGVRLVWVIDPKKFTAAVYSAPDVKTELTEAGVLDGGDVLPGFRLPLAKLFERLEKPGAPPKRKRK